MHRDKRVSVFLHFFHRVRCVNICGGEMLTNEVTRRLCKPNPSASCDQFRFARVIVIYSMRLFFSMSVRPSTSAFSNRGDRISASSCRWRAAAVLRELTRLIGAGFYRRVIGMNRLLVALGTVLVVAGLLWPWLKKMHLFHLPGDIVIDRPGFKFFFPITTMLIVSVVLSIIAWLTRR